MAKPAGWVCPKGCAQQPCPHSQAAAQSVIRSSPLARETLEPAEEK